MWAYTTYDELYHHGIKGQKWGQRRFQYEDGSLTEEGRKRYYSSDGSLNRRGKKELTKQQNIYKKKIAKENDDKAYAVYKQKDSEAVAYANKHHLDEIDDYVRKDEREDYVKNYKQYDISKETAMAVAEYSRMVDMSDEAWENARAEGRKATESAIREMESLSLEELLKRNHG